MNAYTVIAFLLGVVIGGGIMFWNYRKVSTQLTELRGEVTDKVNEALAGVNKLAGKVRGK